MQISVMIRKKQILNVRLAAILDFISAMSLVILVWDLTFCFIFMAELSRFFLTYVNITRLLKFKMAAERQFIFPPQKLIRSLADIAEHICQIKTIPQWYGMAM